MNLTIRRATTADAELIADLSRQTFYETFAAQNTPEDMDKFLAEQFTRQSLIEEVGAEGNTFLLAFQQAAVAGYIRLREGQDPASLPDENAIEIARLYAAKQFIGKGVGKALMQAGINEAIRKGKTYIWLGVWEKNTRAINFYQQWGFEKFDEHDFVLGTDVQRDWLMKKNL